MITARSLMDQGQYQQAFNLIVDQDVQSLPELLGKIECLIDIGFILRDEKVLRYGLYLLEKHGSEVLEVQDLAPGYFLNLAHQYSNMVTLSSFDNEYYGFFTRAEQVKARRYYERVLSYESVSPQIEFEAYKGLGQMYQSSGRGLEALASYQKALKLNPVSREILHEKIRLMKEYAIPSLPNRTEFLQEAWALMEKSRESADDEDDQEDVILKTRILETGLDRSLLETPGEYPVHSVRTHSEEEMFYTDFCLDNQLYLNLCVFCRKCDFTMGDPFSLSSSSLTIRQGQKKRFVRLNQAFQVLKKKYTTGRYLLTDALNTGRNKNYLNRDFSDENNTEKPVDEDSFYQLAASFQMGWSLWDGAAEFICIYWDLKEKPQMNSLFYKGNSLRDEWQMNRSPSLHAVFDLYSDCQSGKDRILAITSQKLSGLSPEASDLDSETLAGRCTLLYAKLNLMIQYLGLMHERNEFSERQWDFPRPLYNFVSIKKRT